MKRTNPLFEWMPLSWKGKDMEIPVIQNLANGELYIRITDLPEPLRSDFDLSTILGKSHYLHIADEEGDCVPAGIIQQFAHEQASMNSSSGSIQVGDDIKPYRLTDAEITALKGKAEEAHQVAQRLLNNN